MVLLSGREYGKDGIPILNFEGSAAVQRLPDFKASGRFSCTVHFSSVMLLSSLLP